MQSELGEYQKKMLEYLKTSGITGISGARFKEHDPEKGNMTHLEFVTSYRSVWCPEIVGEELMKDMYGMIHADFMPVRFNDSYDPAIEFYNRVINHIEALEEECITIQKVTQG